MMDRAVVKIGQPLITSIYMIDNFAACPQNPRILVVDDLADNLFLMQTVLEAEGYVVETAESGQSALNKLQSEPYDLVLLDVMMPHMNGFEVTQKIRQDHQLDALPILLITAHDESHVTKGLALGAKGFVRKPVDFGQLVLKIEQTLTPEGGSVWNCA